MLLNIQQGSWITKSQKLAFDNDCSKTWPFPDGGCSPTHHPSDATPTQSLITVDGFLSVEQTNCVQSVKERACYSVKIILCILSLGDASLAFLCNCV